MSGRRRVEIPPASSVLDELYDVGETPEADTSDTGGGAVSNTPPPSGGNASTTTRTAVRRATDNPSGNRTPAGMTRHTLYITREIAERLDATATGLQRELGGLVPKHRILAAILTAGLDQTSAIGADLRAELINNLNA